MPTRTGAAAAPSPDDGEDVIALSRALIAAPSPNPPGDERAVAQVVQDALVRLGLPPAQVRARAESRPNLIVPLEFGPGGRHLVLCGHLDTKPIGDASWSVDPFREPPHGDRLYGLGSGDMKAAVAAMLIAAAQLRREPPPAGRITLVLAADEEDGAAFGAQFLTAADTSPDLLAADAVVIGEPGGLVTDFDHLHVVSRGIARLRLIATGRQGHSSLSGTPGTRNAGVDAARAVAAIADELRLDVPANSDGLAGWEATVNPGLRYRGGVGYGVLPGEMVVDTEVRLLPGMRREAVERSFVELTRALAARTGADLRVEFDEAPHDWLEPTQVGATDPIVTSARRACTRVLGTAPTLSVFPGTTDATWFGAVAGIPTLPALGPGLLARAHGADEWVSVAAVRRTVELYRRLVVDFCANGGTDE
jgi:acetylornithine deacetylase/succinyl-diaminopimelate desuccinylase-like protein